MDEVTDISLKTQFVSQQILIPLFIKKNFYKMSLVDCFRIDK